MCLAAAAAAAGGASNLLAGLSIASTVASLGAQTIAANAQEDAITAQRRAQAEELQSRAETNLGERVKQARKERARLRVAAGEAGVGGASFEAAMRDSFAQQNQDAALIQKNLAFADRASASRARSAMASINKPNALTAGLQIAGAGYSGYYQGKQIERLDGLTIE